MEKDEPKSRYPKLEKPTYESKLPPHLLHGLDDKERWLVESLDRLNFNVAWLVEKHLEMNAQVIDTDIRLTGVEKWRLVFSSKWTVLAGAGVILVTAAIGHFIGKIFP